MSPDDARQFIRDLMRGLDDRMNKMPKEKFKKIDGDGVGTPNGERLAVYQGSDFTFSQGSNTDDSNEDSKFTFTQ